jgi:hypothetical protein
MKNNPTEVPQVSPPRRQNPFPLILVFILIVLIGISSGVLLRSVRQLADMSNPFSHTATPTISIPTLGAFPTRILIPQTYYGVPSIPSMGMPVYRNYSSSTTCTIVYNGYTFQQVCSNSNNFGQSDNSTPVPTYTPTPTATLTPSPTATITPSPTATLTPTSTNTATPTIFESPVTRAGASLLSLICFVGLLIGVLAWMARQRLQK